MLLLGMCHVIGDVVAKQNVFIRSRKKKAVQLFLSDKLLEAEEIYARICQQDKIDTDAWVMRGIINRKLGLLTDAEGCCRRALEIDNELAVAHQALGTALQCQGRLHEAIASYRRATELQPDLAEAHYLLANGLREVGALNEAVLCYRMAIQVQPNFVEALSNLGAVLNSLEQIPEAVEVLNQAILLRPNSPQILCNLGDILQGSDRFSEALEKYQRALSINSDFIDAVAQASSLLEKMNRLDQAAEFVQTYLPRFPDNPDLLAVAAKLARREKRIDDAIHLYEQAAKQSLGLKAAGNIHKDLGKLYDQKGEVEQAFWHLAEGNRLVAQAISDNYGDPNRYLDRIQRMRTYLTHDLVSVLNEVNHDARESHNVGPVFLLGFARSGTTLLEQILDSHPALQTLDEKPTVSAVVAAFEEMAQSSENTLAQLSKEQIAKLRQVYFNEAARYIDLEVDCLLVDKMPLNTINVHLIWRIFPNAKFILAIRHPCDVLLSCFMQNFRSNEAMLNFLSLEGGATIYQEVMGLWKEAVKLLPLDYHRVRYEDLVIDFEAETRSLLNFLGVGWNASVMGHTRHAIKRGTIKTPSYHQVTQPIYQDAKYRWRRYKKQFESIMPILQPYIEYFGYEE